MDNQGTASGTPLKIAIIGCSLTSAHDAPYMDPSWRIWNMSNNYKMYKRFDLWFEMHNAETLAASGTEQEYFNFLHEVGNKAIMAHPSEHWPDATIYPRKEIMERFGDYFTCTFAYMIALAIDTHLRGRTVECIGLWGVDMGAEGEYSHQKPCAEYYVGWARALGINVYIAPQSPLARCNAMYGYDNPKMSREMTEYLKETELAIAAKTAIIQKETKELTELKAVDTAFKRFCHLWQL